MVRGRHCSIEKRELLVKLRNQGKEFKEIKAKGGESMFLGHQTRKTIPCTLPKRCNILVWTLWYELAFRTVESVLCISSMAYIDQAVYVNILRDVMLSFGGWEMPIKWPFQQDNDPKHGNKLAKEIFVSEKIDVMSWRAQSPDLNLIENL